MHRKFQCAGSAEPRKNAGSASERRWRRKTRRRREVLDSRRTHRRRQESGELKNRETTPRRLVEKFSKDFTVRPKFFEKT